MDVADLFVKLTLVEFCVGDVLARDPAALAVSFAHVAESLRRAQRSGICEMLEAAHELVDAAPDVPLDTVVEAVDNSMLATQVRRNLALARCLHSKGDAHVFTDRPVWSVLRLTERVQADYVQTDESLGSIIARPENEADAAEVDLFETVRPDPRPLIEDMSPSSGAVFLLASSLLLQILNETQANSPQKGGK